jgi:hypothetical protein
MNSLRGRYCHTPAYHTKTQFTLHHIRGITAGYGHEVEACTQLILEVVFMVK